MLFLKKDLKNCAILTLYNSLKKTKKLFQCNFNFCFRRHKNDIDKISPEEHKTLNLTDHNKKKTKKRKTIHIPRPLSRFESDNLQFFYMYYRLYLHLSFVCKLQS